MAANEIKSATSRRQARYWLDREGVLSFLMLFPAVSYILILVGIPFVLAIAYSFSDVTIADQSYDFRGLDTFKRVIDNPVFRTALENSFRFTLVSQAIISVLSVLLGLLLTEKFPGKWLIRFLLLLPWTTPIAFGTLGWRWMLETPFSPWDYALREIGLLGPGTPWGPRRNMFWLSEPKFAVWIVPAIQVWRMLPLSTVIVMAGLSSIPQDIKDAVAVDGVGFFRELFEIKLPLILPITAVATLFGLIFNFTDMTIVHVLARGGPLDSTQVIPSWAFYKGVEGTNLSEGAATAVFMVPVLLALAVFVLQAVRRAEVR